MKSIVMFLFITLSSLGWSADKVLMAVLVKVDKIPLTSRDLQINQFMNEYDNILEGYLEKREPIKEMVWEYLLGGESQELLAREDIQKDYVEYQKRFLEKVRHDKLWKGLDVSADEVKSLLYRRFAAKKLIQLKIPAELIEVTDQEIDSYYALNKIQLGNRPLEDIKAKITKGLREKKAQSRLKDWVAAVTRSHSVVYMSGFRIQ